MYLVRFNRMKKYILTLQYWQVQQSMFMYNV